VTQGILILLGGVGLFLLGMKTMTDALREAAGDRLRGLLARFTTTPLRGTLTGTAATAVVQSSTAVTLMTVGFVGAGMLGFPQALGVLYGANIGTTVTGWMVTILGLKLQLGQIALPGVFLSALLALFGKGSWARAGRGLSGFCLLFIGLDMMQAGLAATEGLVAPERLPGDGWGGRLALVAIGFAVVAVTQSSSAGVAMALVLVASGAVALTQAASMVIGMNLGTTLTALLASLGGSRGMQRTGLANLLFNLVTAVVAFPLIGVVVPALDRAAGGDVQTALMLFHTGFNVAGTLLFLPVTGAFARTVERLLPDRPPVTGPALALDPALRSEPAVALDAAQQAVTVLANEVFAALAAALGPREDLRALAALPERVGPGLAELAVFLDRLSIPEDQGKLRARAGDILHQVDHLARLLRRAEKRSVLDTIATDPMLLRPARALSATLARSVDGREADAVTVRRLARLSALTERRAERHRRETLAPETESRLGIAGIYRRTDAVRWLERVTAHAERILWHRLPAVPGDQRLAPSAATIASPISVVETGVPPSGPIRSAVRSPSASTASTAFSSRSASAPSSKE
jgi:phosphate:Na+ symporter